MANRTLGHERGNIKHTVTVTAKDVARSNLEMTSRALAIIKLAFYQDMTKRHIAV